MEPSTILTTYTLSLPHTSLFSPLKGLPMLYLYYVVYDVSVQNERRRRKEGGRERRGG